MSEPRHLEQDLGLFSATMIVAGSMIGSGIYIVSADITRDVKSPGWLLVVWIITGIMTVIGALSYGELAAMMPRVGGQYVYLREAYSPLWGFLYGWTLFLVIQTGTIAAVAVAFAKFLGAIYPGITAVAIDAGAWRMTWAQVVGIGVIAVLTGSNCFGLRIGKVVQDVFTVTKTGSLAALIVLGLTVGWNAVAVETNTQNFWGEHPPFVLSSGLWAFLPIVGAAMVGSLFSADAWNNVTFTAGEVRNPSRNLPLSLALGTGLVIALYLLANVAYLVDLPLADIQNAPDDRVATAAMERIFPGMGSTIMAIAIMISTFGCENGLILAGARVYYAMAKDGVFFEATGHLNRHNVPAIGLVVQGVWASLLTLSGRYNDLLDYVIFAALVFYVLTVGAVFVLRYRQPDAERPYRAVGYPFLPALYLVLACAVMIDLLFMKPLYTWPGLLIVLTGFPVYFGWRALRGRPRD